VPADQLLDYDYTNPNPALQRVLSAVQIPSFFMQDCVYFMGYGHSVQRGFRSGGAWVKEASSTYELLTGSTELPSEAEARCPDLAKASSQAWNIVAGGSPRSLWVNPGIPDGLRRSCTRNTYLV